MSVPGNLAEKIHLECISKHMKDKKMMRSSQHGLMKEETCLTSLSDVTGSTDKWRAVMLLPQQQQIF